VELSELLRELETDPDRIGDRELARTLADVFTAVDRFEPETADDAALVELAELSERVEQIRKEQARRQQRGEQTSEVVRRLKAQVLGKSPEKIIPTPPMAAATTGVRRMGTTPAEAARTR
jgi:hypothetical protein